MTSLNTLLNGSTYVLSQGQTFSGCINDKKKMCLLRTLEKHALGLYCDFLKLFIYFAYLLTKEITYLTHVD